MALVADGGKVMRDRLRVKSLTAGQPDNAVHGAGSRIDQYDDP